MLYVKKSGLPGAGKGLFTDSLIKKGTKVVEYKGEIIDMKEYDKRAERDEAGYMLYGNKELCIDAYRTPQYLARYANDAKGLGKKNGLFNNCYYDFFGKKGWIVAYRNIQPGSEILVGYGKEYWDDVKYNLKLDRLEKARRKRKAEARKKKTKKKSGKKAVTRKAKKAGGKNAAGKKTASRGRKAGRK